MYVPSGSPLTLQGCKPRSGSVRFPCPQESPDRAFCSFSASLILVHIRFTLLLLTSLPLMRLYIRGCSCAQDEILFLSSIFPIIRILHEWNPVPVATHVVRFWCFPCPLQESLGAASIRRVRLIYSTPATYYLKGRHISIALATFLSADGHLSRCSRNPDLNGRYNHRLSTDFMDSYYLRTAWLLDYERAAIYCFALATLFTLSRASTPPTP
jgi:hypothetical protein